MGIRQTKKITFYVCLKKYNTEKMEDAAKYFSRMPLANTIMKRNTVN